MLKLDSILKGLGYEAAGQILGSLAARGTGFCAADTLGQVYWNAGGSSCDLEVSRALESLVPGAIGSQPRSQSLGDRGSVSIAAICDETGKPRGWLVAWSDEDGDASSSEWKRVTETLPRVAQMLTREFKLARELSGAITELTDRYEELNIVFRMERDVRDVDPQQKVIQKMFDGFLQHLRIDVGMFVSSDWKRPFASRGTKRPIANLDLVMTELKGKIWRFLSAAGKPLVINDVDDERRSYLLTHLPFKLMAIPNGGCRDAESGLLLLRHIEEPDFTNSDMSLARVFFGQSMILLRNQALLERTEHFTRQIASSLVEAVEAKDPYTRGHSERVETITGGIGVAAGIAEKSYEDLLWGALLHDIGKIGIPDAILMKPDRLTDDEYTFIKTHPGRSYDILRHIKQLGATALDGARFHQERFDGRGYPFGLKGTEIPLAARVIAIADTYDAVTSSRSYRSACSHEKAIEIIRNVAGAQLDPDLVQIFLRLIEGNDAWLNSIRPSGTLDDHG